MEKTLELGVKKRRISKMQMRNDQDVEGDKDAPYAMPGGEEGNKSWCPLVQCPYRP